MIHARKDYQGRFGEDPAIKDPSLLGQNSSPIETDEPVMLFRAKDKYFPKVMEFYASLLMDDQTVEDDIINLVEDHIVLAVKWQDENGCKTPDVPKDRGWL